MAPPRAGKSELVSKHFIPWFLGTFRGSRVILVSAEASLAAHFGGQARQLLDEFGPRLWGVQVSTSTAAKSDWEVMDLNGRPAGGACRTAGVGGTIVGRGADLLVLDDYLRNAEDARSQATRDSQYDWFLSTALTRLSPKGVAVAVCTRWHLDDLAGRLLRDMEAVTAKAGRSCGCQLSARMLTTRSGGP